MNNESNFSRMARVVLSYRIQESQFLDLGVELEGNDSNIKLGLTDLGYKYQFNK
jgi:hypothetical protein